MEARTTRRSCCVTGHRDIPVDKIGYVEQELREAIGQAVKDGYTHFISGFAEGADQIFAAVVAELKQDNPDLILEAAIPYRDRIRQICKNQSSADLLAACDVVSVVNEGYFQGCFMKRNRYMVDQSKLVIAVFDGRETGGTAATIRYAHRQKKIVSSICLTIYP